MRRIGLAVVLILAPLIPETQIPLDTDSCRRRRLLGLPFAILGGLVRCRVVRARGRKSDTTRDCPIQAISHVLRLEQRRLSGNIPVRCPGVLPDPVMTAPLAAGPRTGIASARRRKSSPGKSSTSGRRGVEGRQVPRDKAWPGPLGRESGLGRVWKDKLR